MSITNCWLWEQSSKEVVVVVEMLMLMIKELDHLDWLQFVVVVAAAADVSVSKMIDNVVPKSSWVVFLSAASLQSMD